MPSQNKTKITDNDTFEWIFHLYIAGQTPRSIVALDNLKQLCEAHLKGLYYIDVIDLQENPQRARDDEILAVPTLVRIRPAPTRKIIGDLSDTEQVLSGLQLKSSQSQLSVQ